MTPRRAGVVLGVDAGGTKTDVAVVSLDGTVLSRRLGPGANHESVGFTAAAATIRATTDAALTAASCAAADIAAAAWVVAGLDWPGDEAALLEQLRRTGVAAPTVLCNDLYGPLRAGLGERAGVVVCAGTGVVAAGRSADGHVWRTYGMSSGPGDWGGGPEIVRAAINAIGQAAMGFGRPTALAAAALRTSGAADVAGFLAGVLRGGPPALVPDDVWAVAGAGDAVAIALLDRLTVSLATAVSGVAAQVGLAGSAAAPLDVVLAGRVLDPGHPLVHAGLKTLVRDRFPTARLRRLGLAPVVGAVQLAADTLGIELTAAELGHDLRVGEPVAAAEIGSGSAAGRPLR